MVTGNALSGGFLSAGSSGGRRREGGELQQQLRTGDEWLGGSGRAEVARCEIRLDGEVVVLLWCSEGVCVFARSRTTCLSCNGTVPDYGTESRALANAGCYSDQRQLDFQCGGWG